MSKKNVPLILASSSPRRRELLKVAGVTFTVQVSDVDETPLKRESPERMVQRLAEAKAHAVLNQVQGLDEFFILAADTTVVSKSGKNLGKPESREEAFRMLSTLQGKDHFVFTAYAILKVKKGKVVKKISKRVKTVVTFKKLTKHDINFYIDQGECMDKAGAYGAQGAGVMLVSKMSGSYTNVVGLPLSHVLDDFKKIGFLIHGQ